MVVCPMCSGRSKDDLVKLIAGLAPTGTNERALRNDGLDYGSVPYTMLTEDALIAKIRVKNRSLMSPLTLRRKSSDASVVLATSDAHGPTVSIERVADGRYILIGRDGWEQYDAGSALPEPAA